MNKLFNLGAMLTIAAGAMMINSSCSSHDIEYNGGEIVKADYEAAFVNTFGTPATNQTWGFGDFSNGVKSGATRGSNVECKTWADNYDVPKPLTDEQKDIVRRYFQQNQKPTGVSINYTDFFVQQVYKGGTNTTDALTTEKYMAANGTTELGSGEMDYLTAGTGDDNHIFNFNNGTFQNGNPYTDVWNGTYWGPDPNNKNYHSDNIMLVENSSTSCFGYSNSGASRHYDDQFVIISGDAIMSWAKAENKELDGADVSGMYFVGFDFNAIPDTNANGEYKDAQGNSTLQGSNRYLVTEVAEGTEGAFQVPNKNDGKWYIGGGADGYYSDWIIRVKPGTDETPEVTPVGAIRVIAEDLSATSGTDFDFNDVVFDVKLGYPTANQTTITLLAAGGTLPLTVAGTEVHEAFGVETNQMVNTGAGPEVAPKEIVLNASYTNAIDIPVKVLKNGEWIDLTAERAEAAAKIAVPTSFDWCQERVNITSEYPKFKDYVTSTDWKDIVWWEK